MPEGWQTVPIGDVLVSAQYGLNLPVKPDGTVPIIGMKDMVAGRVENSGWGCVDLPASSRARFLLRDGDILLNRTNSPDLVGKVALWDRSEGAVFPSYIVRFRADEDQAEAAFLNYVLNSDDGQTRLKALSTRGVSQANINPTTFRQAFTLALPPIAEQRRIAAVLDTWDSAIALAERLCAQLTTVEQRRLAVLGDAWDQRTLESFGRFRGGGTPSKAREEYWSHGTIPWVSSKDMDGFDLCDTCDHITAAAVEGSATNLIPAGSILVVVRSGILRHTVPVAINARPVAINQDIKALLVHDGTLGWLVGRLLFLRQAQLRDAAVKIGTTVESIDIDALRSFEIPFPANEQVASVTGLFKTMAAERRLHTERLSLLYRQKRGLMQKLLTGEWRVPATGDAFVPGGSAADRLEAAE